MNVKKIILWSLILLSHKSFSQPVDIPKGVNYAATSDSVNNAAKKILAIELSQTKDYALFDKLLYVGPQLWNRYKKIPSLSNIVGGNIQVNIPLYDKRGNIISQEHAQAKLIQNISDFKLLWNQVIQDFSGDTSNIRKLTAKEIQYYWAIIFYNIEEPVFVIENKKIKLLVQFTNDKLRLFWIDEILF